MILDFSDKCIIQNSNLSLAWADTFLKLMDPGVSELIPLIVVIEGFNNGQPEENDIIRNELDSTLNKLNMSSCETVANTIFPRSLWNPRTARCGRYA